jgi:hypothetical protein
MAITNGYVALDDLARELSISDSLSDTKLELAISAASRQIDAYCQRFFYQDSAVVDRTYYPDDYVSLEVDDISTLTDLVVKVDNDNDGTFETTLTITTNFIVTPTNAADEYPVRPYTGLRLVDSGVSNFPIYASGRPSVQVTAKFGWPAIPEDVQKACLIQSAQLFKSSDALFGGLNFDTGIFRVRDTLNPMAAALLERYAKPRIG